MQGKTGLLGQLRLWLFTLVLLPATLILALLVISSSVSPAGKKTLARLQGPVGTLDEVAFAPLESLRAWAQFAPFSSVDRYPFPPKGCNITQVNDTSFGVRFI
jgi:hypothetical protein